MKSQKNFNKLSVNITTEDDDNDFLYCWDKFEDRPNKIKIFNSYLKDYFLEIIDTYKKEISFSSEVIPTEDYDIVNEKQFIKISDEIYVSFIILDKDSETSMIHEVSFFFKSQEELELVQEISTKLDECIVDLEEDHEVKHNLHTITIGPQGLDLESICKGESDDTELFYDENTFKSLNQLIKKIKKSNKGLSVLYGERGTGKTSAIKYLSDKIDRNIIYIPNSMLDSTISNPDFRLFLRKYQKPVIIIDDCEMIFNELFTKSNIYGNNLLQMVDGLLSDFTQVNIVTIFNVCDENEIDHTLLDCNSLHDVVYFDYLDEEQSTDLSKHLGNNKKYKTNTKLIDIIRKTKSKETKKTGLY